MSTLTELLSVIEARAELARKVCYAGNVTNAKSAMDVPKLVKALRMAVGYYTGWADNDEQINEADNSVAQLLREPAGKQDLEETKDLGEPGAA